MNHPDELTLLRYRFDTLEPEDADEVATHLRTCSKCMTAFAELGQGLDLVGQWEVEDELSDDMSDAIMRQVRQRAEQQEAEDAAATASRARQEAEELAAAAARLAADEDETERPARNVGRGRRSSAPSGSLRDTAAAPVPRLRSDEQEEPPRERLGFWAWIGLAAGGSMRLVRLTTALVVLAGTGFVAGGAVYYGGQKVAIDTRVTGDEVMMADSPSVLLVEVFNKLTRKPVERAAVTVNLLKHGKLASKLYAGVTNRQGKALASFWLPASANKGGAYRFEVLSVASGEKDRVEQPIRFRRAFKVHMSTDKPLYQPGQTVHIRTLVLERPRLTPPAGKEVMLDVIDPKGVRLARRKVAVSRFGVGAWSLELASGLRLGSYVIKAQVDGTTSEMKVKVARYTLPKFKIEVEPAKSFFLAGETMRAKIQARYFFGKSLSKAAVRVVLFRPNGAVIGDEIKGEADADGVFDVSAELPADLVRRGGAPQRVTMEVAVKDAAGQEERKQTGVTVTRDLLQIDAVPEGGRLVAGLTNNVYVLTTTPDGKAAAARVQVTLPDGKVKSLQTRQNGLGLFRFEVPERGRGGRRAQLLRLSATDSEGQRGARKLNLLPRSSALLVATDRAFYKPGETVKVAIQTTSGDEYVAAQVEGIREGQTVLRSRVKLKNGAGTAHVDLPANLTGTVRLDVTALDEYDIATKANSRRVVVADAQGLQVKISSAKASHRPGKEAKLTFKVTDGKGKPKAAAIGLSIVDESVLALAASRPALARAYFLLERHLMEPRYNFSAADTVADGQWNEARQEAGRLLLSLAGDTTRPTRFYRDTYQVKEASLAVARKQFEKNAKLVGLAVALVLALVLVVAAASRLPSWAGGILLALGASVAVLFAVPLLWVAVALAAGMAMALFIHHRRSRTFAWPVLAIPVVALVLTSMTNIEKLKPIGARDSRVATTDTDDDDDDDGESSGSRTLKDFDKKEPTEQEASPDPTTTGADSADESAPVPETPRVAAARPKPAPPRAPRRRKAARSMSLKGRGGSGRESKKDMSRLLGATKKIPRRTVRVRRHFPETMYVHPELVTNEKGVATLTVRMADSITSWRVSALASAADGKIGYASEPLKAFQDFFVDLDMPVALVRGDEATVPVAVYNYLSTPQIVRLELKREPWYQLLGPDKMALRLPAGGVDGAEVRLRVLKTGKHRLGLQADGTKLSDALARQLMVSAAGQERSDSASGTLRPGETVRVTVQMPDAAVKGTSRLKLKLFPSILSSALDGLESTLRMPHGCFEQTSSANYPNVLILDYLKRSGKGTAQIKQTATRYISLGYQKLVGYEVSGGGFSLYGRRPARLKLTAYGLMEFADMARVMSVDEKLIKRTQAWLLAKQKPNGSFYNWPGRRTHRRWPRGVRVRSRRPIYRQPWSSRRGLMLSAYVSWALAESGYRGPRMTRALDYLADAAAGTSDPYTTALISAALVKGKHRLAPTALRRLAGMATRQAELVHFTPRYGTIYYGRGRGGAAEATSLAAYALGLGKVEPKLVRGALDYLAKTRDHRGTWYSTQGTVLALRTLLQFAGPDGDQQVMVRINGKDAGNVALKAASTKPQLVDLGTNARHGANVVELTGQARATFQVIATYVLPWQEKVDDKDKPLSLKVVYGRTQVAMGGVVPVDVSLTYRRPDYSGMIMLTLGLPAGFFPIPQDLAALKADGSIGRHEITATAINLYVNPLRTNATLRMNLRLKARNKVRTKGASSLAYLYYHPEVRTSAAPTPVVVN